MVGSSYYIYLCNICCLCILGYNLLFFSSLWKREELKVKQMSTNIKSNYWIRYSLTVMGCRNETYWLSTFAFDYILATTITSVLIIGAISNNLWTCHNIKSISISSNTNYPGLCIWILLWFFFNSYEDLWRFIYFW